MGGASTLWAAARDPAVPLNARSRADGQRPDDVHGLCHVDRRRAGVRDRARDPGALAVARFVRDNGLSLAFGAIFLASLAGQAISGADTFNHGQALHNGDPISFGHYVTSAAFWADVMENWQSEYLQFTLYIFGTIWLIQRGSNESKQPDRVGLEDDEQQLLGEHTKPDSPAWAKAGGWRTAVFSNSLLLVMGS